MHFSLPNITNPIYIQHLTQKPFPCIQNSLRILYKVIGWPADLLKFIYASTQLTNIVILAVSRSLIQKFSLSASEMHASVTS
jgi:hypothetical protein